MRKNKSSFLKMFSLKIMWYSIKEKFVELARSVRCECVLKIFKKNTYLTYRLVWGFLFVTFSFMTFYLMIKIFLDYFRYLKHKFLENSKFKFIYKNQNWKLLNCVSSAAHWRITCGISHGLYLWLKSIHDNRVSSVTW